MGAGASKAQPGVHVVVAQSNEDGSIRAEHLPTENRESDGDRRRSRPVLHSNSPQYSRGKRRPRHEEPHSLSSSPPTGSHSSPSPAAVTGQGPEFKIFKTIDNNEYTVHCAEDGSMYYVDWAEQKWRVFPTEWIKGGKFENLDTKTNGDREGELIHPFRGKLTTLLRQESLNVMYFFDESNHGWLPMPLSWERQTPFVSRLVAETKNVCSDWDDDLSIVATLRQCNYSAEDSVNCHIAINDEGVFNKFKDKVGGSSLIFEKLQEKIKELETELKECRESKATMKEELTALKDILQETKAENEQLKQELKSFKTEQRKQSVVLQQSMGRGSMRLPAITAKMNILRPTVQNGLQEIRNVKFKLHTTRQQLKKSVRTHTEQMNELSKAVRGLLVRFEHQSAALQETRALYRKEAVQRKLLFNQVQELRGNIRVFCRCRHDERSTSDSLSFEGEDTVSVTTANGKKRKYEFEKVYSPKTTQDMVFEDTRPIITSCADGYNVCIIAYGQTGAGKTYTMMGPRDNPGVNVRSIKELFNIMKEKDKTDFEMKVSMVEVYNESIYDLLKSPNEVQEKLQIHKKGKELHVPGLTEIEVCSTDDVIKVMTVGEKNRTTASTKMNTNSSRSHLLLRLVLVSYNSVSKTTTRGSLTLVDLAGSERISRSEATGLRLVEAAAINKSLSALGQVFSSIRENSLHIPFRNSKLTHLLQQCLGGDAKACMFVNVSPLDANVPETISTLEFGMNARQVALGKATTHITKTT
ncbi:PREDICTED: kinesin-like protein KIN-14P [Amphimedon queenslandica]|uniref:Kinesin-like protein n=1 Tax=Amphimedon queenslandica TaxID=400682 RepID=A0A1X7U1P5_AMPQE|nr:PREDICTED: kinesin-like protein KIN-14P [Amphimedon queenslandica]|eukprot:XP_003389225.1 PREDICTED: kinesin-like protein KIN-14P [Amphimedon queenslandica]